jgi:hypothetical protein
MQKPGLFGMNGFIMFLLLCVSFAARAQQPGYLILIDAENRQAFTVHIGDQIYASTGHGHIVLSQLKDSSYRLYLRFSKKNLAEQVFPVTIHQRDLGFQLKGSDSSCILYNWQTKETIRPVFERDSSRILEMGVRRRDGFSRLMASVVNDSAVMYNTYSGNGFSQDSLKHVALLRPATGQKDSLIAVNRLPATANNPLVATNQKDSLAALKKQTVANTKDSLALAKRTEKARKDSIATYKRLAIASQKDSLLAASRQPATANLTVTNQKDSLATLKKQVAANTKDSLALAKKTEKARKDSIATYKRLAIASQKDSLLAANRKPATAGSQLPGTSHPENIASGVKKLREVSLKISRKLVYLDVGKDGNVDTITLFVFFETGDTAVRKQAAEPIATIKKPPKSDSVALAVVPVRNKPVLKPGETGCSQLATEDDVQSLRSAILIANSDQDKISVASGAFALKCFSVSQIRLLTGLLVSDKSKFRLMDAAHLHIADHDHFPELVDMLTDKNFQRKFLAMAEKRS